MSHVRLAAASAASAIAATLLCGCVEPTVDTVVAWVESVDDGSGRDVQIYDRGRRYAVRLEPDEAGSDLGNYGLAVDPRGLGIAQAGGRRLSYTGLTDTRQPVLTNALFGGAQPSSNFAFTRNGDGLLRAPGGTTAVRYAFTTVGSAILATTLIIVSGFLMLGLSTFRINFELGVLTAMAITMAVVADFFLLPALLLFGTSGQGQVPWDQ